MVHSISLHLFFNIFASQIQQTYSPIDLEIKNGLNYYHLPKSMPNGELISAPVSLLSQAESSISEYLNEYSPEITFSRDYLNYTWNYIRNIDWFLSQRDSCGFPCWGIYFFYFTTIVFCLHFLWESYFIKHEPVKVSRQQPQYTLRTMYENATIKPTPYRYKVRHRAPLGLEFALADAMHSSASINSPSISSSADLTGPWNTDLFIIDDTSKFVFGRRNSSLDSLRGSQNTRQF